MEELKPGSKVFYVGSRDWDRRLFDELIPLPDGTSYNSYLIKGSEKTALIDTVDPTKKKDIFDALNELKADRIDYVICDHAEQDHSGSLNAVLDVHKEARLVTNPKCKELLKELLLISDDRFVTVNDRDKLSLGDKTLEFIYAPWVHWPETMFTYLKEDGILFTCDFLGSHQATSDLFVKDEARTYESAKRYYAEIMMPFRTSVRQNLDKIRPLAFDVVAPSHGPLYNKPKFIMDAYADWSSDNVKNEVVLPYVSMHGSTAAMAERLIEALVKRNIKVMPFNLTKTDLGELAISLVDAATIVIGSPTVLTGPHPAAVSATFVANALRPKTRFASLIGSYGWAGKMPEVLTGMLGNLKVELIPPVIVKGYPTEKDMAALDALADSILAKHRSLGIA